MRFRRTGEGRVRSEGREMVGRRGNRTSPVPAAECMGTAPSTMNSHVLLAMMRLGRCSVVVVEGAATLIEW